MVLSVNKERKNITTLVLIVNAQWVNLEPLTVKERINVTY